MKKSARGAKNQHKKTAGAIKLPCFRFTPALFAVDDSSYQEGDFLDAPVKALYNVGFEARPSRMDPAGAFLYSIADTFLTHLAETNDVELLRENVRVPLDTETASFLLSRLPFAQGSEYVTPEWLFTMWRKLNDCFCEEIKDFNGTVSLYLAEKSQNLQVADKIFFHLIETPQDPECPFSFMATYSTKSVEGGFSHIEHMPLKYALIEFKGNAKKMRTILEPLSKASNVCPTVNQFVNGREGFLPVHISAQEAYSLLKAIPQIEDAGIVCRIPDWWKKKRHSVSVGIKLGQKQESLLGLQSILNTEGYLALDGEELTAQEEELLLNHTDGLALIKGKWIEVDQEKLKNLLLQVDHVKKKMTLLEALHINMTVPKESSEEEPLAEEMPPLENGDWLSSLLRNLSTSSAQDTVPVPASFTATLRPYQQTGFSWLNKMLRYGFGACLADDMGLGKTVQMLCYLENIRVTMKDATVLLVVPSSLLGNWQKECAKFAPEMSVRVLHGAPSRGRTLDNKTFLTITTYTMVSRVEELFETMWTLLVLDEAQAIKNPLSKQTKRIKAIPCQNRIALTGTPVENDLTNLWSLFDFLNRGLLGSSEEFKNFCKSLPQHPAGYSKLKAMISPFMLRRLKTDKSIISDLPEKIEMVDYVSLCAKQKALYKNFVDTLEEKLSRIKDDDDPMKKRGLVLASLIKLKQICNHPDQFTGEELYNAEESGKFAFLKELCTTIYQKRERVLVFTQFTEICAPLDNFLFSIFGSRGFILNGTTSVKKRSAMVEAFQSERYIPYMIISVKAGGTGLTLTKANHVIHFDRWWNPAVENQATDRAFRIGQKKNVMVHKIVCKGTIEEKINELIERKKNLAEQVIGSGSPEGWITELSTVELIKLFSLDAE